MFTGIIEEVGRISRIEELGGGRRITVAAAMSPALRPDQSVAVNGACQTVVAAGEETFTVVAVEETLRKTTFGSLAEGDPVNLERALLPSSRLDGHFVMGHVDTTGVISGIEALETSRLYTVRYPPANAGYLIPVGSITVDGISLTVARLEQETLTVSIIPHTYEHTAIAATWRPEAAVNLEFDLIGKYVVRSLRLGEESGLHKYSERG